MVPFKVRGWQLCYVFMGECKMRVVFGVRIGGEDEEETVKEPEGFRSEGKVAVGRKGRLGDVKGRGTLRRRGVRKSEDVVG